MVAIIEKLLLLVLAIVNAAVGGVIVKYSNTEAEYIHGWLPTGVDLSVKDLTIIINIIAVVFILRGIQLFARALSPGKEKKHTHSINRKTELGEIQVSMETLESLSLKAVTRIKGIHDVKAHVRVADQGLTIRLRCLMDGDASIPVVSEEMQKAVKEHVQAISGIPVNHVTISISNIQRSQASKSRLE